MAFSRTTLLYLLPIYQTAQCHNPEHHKTNTEHLENVIYYTINQNHLPPTLLPIIMNKAGTCNYICLENFEGGGGEKTTFLFWGTKGNNK